MLDQLLTKEWLATNGLGGYASSTICMAHTRRYHGLLMASLRPPSERFLLVSKVDTIARYRDRNYPLSCNEFADGTIEPHEYLYLRSFQLDGQIPVWTYAIEDALLEIRLWMAYGHNTTFIRYTLQQASVPLSLELIPLCTYRDYHSHSRGGWDLHVHEIDGGLEVIAFEGAQPYRIIADRGHCSLEQAWYWNFKHRLETLRGLDDIEDLFRPGSFHISIERGQQATIACSTEDIEPHASQASLQSELERQQVLLDQFEAEAPPWIGQLALAADQFIVSRGSCDAATEGSKTIGSTLLAGYPWFGEWGRDTMIALPGLTLATGREREAEQILRTYSSHMSQGLLPNYFPDVGEEPEYNTVDAALWYFQAIDHYFHQTGDLTLVTDLYPVLQKILEQYESGTRYQISVDPNDGLLQAGQEGVQLTWMDAKVGENVITPRIGKPVEVNALWYNAICIMQEFAHRLNDQEHESRYRKQAQHIEHHFNHRFWYPEGSYLYDVIDGPEGMLGPDGKRYDPSLRPNQLFAVALPFQILDEKYAHQVVRVCEEQLYTPHGLRSLSHDHPAFQKTYQGDPSQRDAAYHQGTVWAWLLGPFALAYYRVTKDREKAIDFLSGMEGHLEEACFGQVSEIFDGDPPHTPRGCFAQAWSVAEILRAWSLLR